LFVGGALARAAEAPGGAPTSSSVTWTDANGDPSGPGGATTTTTTTVGAGGTTPSTDGGVSVSVNGANDNTGSTGGSVGQTFSVSVLPGQLTVTPASESVSFTNAHGQGKGGQLAGSLATVKVVDARGSLVGWRATVSLQSVAGVSAADLAKATLCVSPHTPTVVAGNPPEVRAGRTMCGGAGDPLRLFFAPPNGGGGTFSDTGSLTLHLPGVPTADAALATLAVAVQ
jgi:hypothetical protein